MEIKPYHYAIGAAAILGGVFLVTRSSAEEKKKAAPGGPGTALPKTGSFPALVGGTPLIVPVGARLTAFNPAASQWVGSGVSSSNAAIVQPTGVQGEFVAVAPGVCVIIGTYSVGTVPSMDQPIPITDTVKVTVVAAP